MGQEQIGSEPGCDRNSIDEGLRGPGKIRDLFFFVLFFYSEDSEQGRVEEKA